MGDTKTVEALTEALPRVGESENVWCSVQGHDLRAAVSAIAALTARAEAAEARVQELLGATPAGSGSTLQPPAAASAAIPGAWQSMESAPHDETVLLRVPTRWGKWQKYIAASGRWMGTCWVLFNADEAVQCVDPTGWMRTPCAKCGATKEEAWD